MNDTMSGGGGKETIAYTKRSVGDDSPSLKGRGFYGFAPRLCRPTAIRLASFNTREVECAAPAYRTSTTSKTRSCFYPRERLTVERPNTIQLARCYQAVSHISSDARLRARRQSSPALKGRGPLPPKGKHDRQPPPLHLP